MNLQNVLELDEVSSCTQGIQEFVLIQTFQNHHQNNFLASPVSMLPGFNNSRVFLVGSSYSWMHRTDRITPGSGGWSSWLSARLYIGKTSEGRRGVSCVHSWSMPTIPPSRHLASSLPCYDELGYLTGKYPLRKLCKRSDVSHAVMVGYKIHDLPLNFSLLYLKSLCWALCSISALWAVTSDLCVSSTTSLGRQGWWAKETLEVLPFLWVGWLITGDF